MNLILFLIKKNIKVFYKMYIESQFIEIETALFTQFDYHKQIQI